MSSWRSSGATRERWLENPPGRQTWPQPPDEGDSARDSLAWAPVTRILRSGLMGLGPITCPRGIDELPDTRCEERPDERHATEDLQLAHEPPWWLAARPQDRKSTRI